MAIITALEYNQWFTKVSIKDYKLVNQSGFTHRTIWGRRSSATVQMFPSVLSDSLSVC